MFYPLFPPPPNTVHCTQLYIAGPGGGLGGLPPVGATGPACHPRGGGGGGRGGGWGGPACHQFGGQGGGGQTGGVGGEGEETPFL